MSVIYETVLLKSQKDLSISSGTLIAIVKYAVGGSTSVNVTADGADRNGEGWATYIAAAISGLSSDFNSGEFVTFTKSDLYSITIKNEDLAGMLGFEYNTEVFDSSFICSGTFWGWSRLILQGAYDSSNNNKHSSIITKFDENGDISIESMRGYNSLVNSWRRSFFGDRFEIIVDDFPKSRQEWLYNFFDQNCAADSDAEIVRVQGYWNKDNTDDYKIDLDGFSGLESIDKRSNYNLKRLTLNIVEILT